MNHFHLPSLSPFRLALVLPFLAASTPAGAHEAWLLTPAEIESLAAAPVPAIFTSQLWLGVAALLGTLAVLAALAAEDRLRPWEGRVHAGLSRVAAEIGPLILRLSIATMLALSALGGLPRHGTAAWTEPTLLVPDMQLALAPGWGWLQWAQLCLAGLLFAGLATRAAGLALIGVSGLGLAAFGPAFLAYAPHFVAPGLMLAILGGGALSFDPEAADRQLVDRAMFRDVGWRAAGWLTGGCFLYLAVVYKLTQPTLIIAILEHGAVPTMGLPYPVVALLMTGVEIVAGLLLMMGVLTRLVATVLIGAITFLSATLGETPLFHANLYGIMAALALSGSRPPLAPTRARSHLQVTA